MCKHRVNGLLLPETCHACRRSLGLGQAGLDGQYIRTKAGGSPWVYMKSISEEVYDASEPKAAPGD